MSSLYIYLVLTCILSVSNSREDIRRAVRGYMVPKNIVVKNVTSHRSDSDHSRLNKQEIQNTKDKVTLTVYYETLCPASVRFFARQLRPAVEKLSSHLDVRLIPYGFATTYNIGGHYMFRCQHGPDECYANKIHACVVKTFSNNTKAALFNACLMRYSFRGHTGYNFEPVLNWCSYKFNVPVSGIWDCVNSDRGSVILKNYGDETQTLRPNYVPYLLIDNSTEKQDEADVNLISTICRMLVPIPRACFRY